jgi:glycosyltransferase involved in cell wall biosynthesis
MKHAPSQRFRVELFLPELKKIWLPYVTQSFFDEKAWHSLYSRGGSVNKILGVIRGFARRWYIVLFGLSKFSHVFIHREAAPVGPPIFEWIISKIFRKKIIYDFDDAIWIPNTSSENRIISMVKCFWKVKYICKWAHKVVGGNDFLIAYASQYNNKLVKIPTCVDTVHVHNRVKYHKPGKTIIGWTGSHSTMKFLDELLPVFKKIINDHDVEIVIISNKEPSFSFPQMRYLPWNEDTEVDDLLQLDIGLMPLQQDPWCEGKCGFKLIQYLSLGIPAIASPVGVNKNIIENGITGYLCETEEQWLSALAVLINDSAARQSMGNTGRIKIERDYSIKAYAVTFKRLFNG